MKRVPLVTLILPLLFISLAFLVVLNVNFGLAQNATDVVIESDTTWLSGRTYYFDGSVFVAEGVTLTIQEGVIVDFGDTISRGWVVKGHLSVHGKLNALGTNANPIRINNTVVFERNSSDSSRLEGAIVNGRVFVDTSAMINNNTIYNSIIVGTDCAPLISNNTIIGTGQDYGIRCTQSIYQTHIIGNTISGFKYGISITAPPIVEQNLIFNNEAGIIVSIPDDSYHAPYDLTGLKILNNTIVSNKLGVDLATATPLIIYNNIYSNLQNGKEYNLASNLLNAEIDAANNWWGTTQEHLIKSTIDGSISFKPYLTSPNSNAPTAPHTMNPAPTFTPTLSPTYTVTPSNTPTPAQTPSPTIPELPANTALLAAILGLAVALVVILKCYKQKPN